MKQFGVNVGKARIGTKVRCPRAGPVGKFTGISLAKIDENIAEHTNHIIDIRPIAICSCTAH